MTRKDLSASVKQMIWRVREARETGQGDIGKDSVSQTCRAQRATKRS